MALTTFVAGNVLTAAQLNDSFANVGGLRLVKDRTTFSAATSVTADGIFTASFTNYLVVVEYRTSAANAPFYRLRASGSSANTNYNYQSLDVSGTTVTAARSTAQAQIIVGNASSGAFNGWAISFISRPALAEGTVFMNQSSTSGGAYTNPELRMFYGNHSTATAYDGLEIAISGGTNMTGAYTIFGIGETGD